MLDPACLDIARRDAQRDRAVVHPPSGRHRRIGIGRKAPPRIGVGRKDQHRFPHGSAQTANSVLDRVGPLTLDRFDKDIPARRILHRDVKMHPRSSIVFIRLGHETRGHTMGAGVHANDTLQAHQIIRRFHHIVAVVQGHFILAGGEFGNQGFGLDPDQLCRFVDIVEQGQHPVQLVNRIDIGFV